jgi:hypothetical protein
MTTNPGIDTEASSRAILGALSSAYAEAGNLAAGLGPWTPEVSLWDSRAEYILWEWTMMIQMLEDRCQT